MFVERSNDGANARVRLGILLLQPRCNRRHFCLRLFQADARFHASDHLEIMVSALPGFIGSEGNRNPKLICPARKLETFRHDPDDCETLAIQIDAPTDNRRIRSKPSLPQAVAQNNDMICASPIFFRQERAA